MLANRYGWRVGTHAVGDAAVDLVLDAYDGADKDKSIKDRRFIVIHGSLMTREQIVRAKQLGVRVDAQNIFMWDKAAAVERYMGPALANRAVPSRVAGGHLGHRRHGGRHRQPGQHPQPVRRPVHHGDAQGPARARCIGADQALTREEALRLYTNAGPYYTFDERSKGAIEVGKLADMVVLVGRLHDRARGPDQGHQARCRRSSTTRSSTTPAVDG